MVRTDTPVEYYSEWGLHAKREDLCCPGGPNFSKTRGVYAHIVRRPEKIIGVLDTSHSQGGWAVAKACSLLGRQCLLFYPSKGEKLRAQQEAAAQLGASLHSLKPGRSAVLYHRAKALLPKEAYMMPNALKLIESVDETALEVGRTDLPDVNSILVSASSGTIAAGVLKGLQQKGWKGRLLVHLGYSRPERAVRSYIVKMAGFAILPFQLIDEGYAYADEAREGPVPQWRCSSFYDLKAFRWWVKEGRNEYGSALFWNIG